MRERRTPEYCDYQGSDYRAAFWGTGERDFEDAAERIALRRLMPASGERLIEIGAGFGRLADLYSGYNEIILLDPAESMLRQAQERLGPAGFTYICGSIYDLPLADGSVDVALTIRVLHHLADVPRALREVRRVLRPGGHYILEYANKRNLKAILRFLLRGGPNPFSHDPYEFVPLNYDFHPAYIAAELRDAHFSIREELSVSNLRLPLLKRIIAPDALARADKLLQGPAAPLKLGPSMFLEALPLREEHAPHSEALLRCPTCHSTDLVEAGDRLSCRTCGQSWPVEDDLYYFKSHRTSCARLESCEQIRTMI